MFSDTFIKQKQKSQRRLLPHCQHAARVDAELLFKCRLPQKQDRLKPDRISPFRASYQHTESPCRQSNSFQPLGSVSIHYHPPKLPVPIVSHLKKPCKMLPDLKVLSISKDFLKPCSKDSTDRFSNTLAQQQMGDVRDSSRKYSKVCNWFLVHSLSRDGPEKKWWLPYP